MIAHIEGKLTEKTPTHVVIDCSGVGYLLNISLNTFGKLADSGQVRLFAHLSIKEDAHTLFGFFDEEERNLFRHLISVSGVGPGTARMILSSLSPAEIQHAIVSANVAAIKAVKGIGEKTAQRIIVDLKDKVGKSDAPQPTIFFAKNNTLRQEALSAMVQLGFAKNAAEKALDKILKQSPDIGIEQLIKQALNQI